MKPQEPPPLRCTAMKRASTRCLAQRSQGTTGRGVGGDGRRGCHQKAEVGRVGGDGRRRCHQKAEVVCSTGDRRTCLHRCGDRGAWLPRQEALARCWGGRRRQAAERANPALPGSWSFSRRCRWCEADGDLAAHRSDDHRLGGWICYGDFHALYCYAAANTVAMEIVQVSKAGLRHHHPSFSLHHDRQPLLQRT